MIDLIELDPAELARIHDVPTEQVCCRYCRLANRHPLVDRDKRPYAMVCGYWHKAVDLKACCTSWQPRKESKEMAEKEMLESRKEMADKEELKNCAELTATPVINANLESGAMLINMERGAALTLNITVDMEDGDD